ncbi:MAG: hypothetical protein AAGA96_20630, partial [Verrucomicrobiota bacterium]
MILKTSDITRRSSEIAKFSEIPESSVRQTTHAFRNPSKFGVLAQLPPAHLEAKVNENCKGLMGMLFPEIRSMSDANLESF